MPKQIEKKLKQQAEKKGLKKGSKAYRRYVYGTLNRIKRDE